MSGQLPKENMLDFAGDIKTTDLDGSEVHLYSDGPPIDGNLTNDSTLFTEASFGGYSAVTTSTWNPPLYDDANGAISIDVPVMQFTHSSAVDTGCLIKGYYVTTPSTTHMVFAEELPTPVSVPSVGYGVDVTPSLKLQIPQAS